MTPLNNETYKELVLIGGGHTHAIFLSMWADMPIPGVRITLVSPDVMTPYSGMLPGLIAGHFKLEETHIDLSRLCQYAGIRFIKTYATLIEPNKNTIQLKGRPALNYDLLSINCGITPNLDIPGAREFAIGVKPISTLYKKWQSLICELSQQKNQAINLTVVGGGVAGVEFAQAIQHRLNNSPNKISITIIQKGQGLPESSPALTQTTIRQRLNQNNIEVRELFKVVKIEKTDRKKLRLYGEGDQTHNADHIFWCTNATGSSWLRKSSLPLSKDGFLTTNDYLQIEKHNNIFATGDCATQLNYPRPRAGVFAVRQATTLNTNLRAHLLGKPLRKHVPQENFLSLITGGDQWAVAARGRWPIPNFFPTAIWRWKLNIDQAFMKKLSPTKLPQMPHREISTNIKPEAHRNHDMRCGGCGAKVGQRVLNKMIDSLDSIERDSINIGLGQQDDAASFIAPPGKEVVQSVDALKQLVSDPFLQGQIAAEHALSDLFAMDAEPHSAQAIVTLPIGSDLATLNDLRLLMSGAVDVLNRHNCSLIGGHTSEGSELSIGFCVNGFRDQQRLEEKKPTAGDTLILTKPLGVGVLFAAHSQLGIGGSPIETAISNMLQSNRQAAEIFRQHHVSKLTDVTGFGLAGHLLQILGNSSACVQLSALPTLTGTEFCFEKGFTSSLHAANFSAADNLITSELAAGHSKYPALFDPQTSGGLLAIAPREEAGECIRKLHEAGYKQAAIIGHIENTTGDPEKQIRIEI